MNVFFIFTTFLLSSTLLYCQSNTDSYYENALSNYKSNNFQDAITNFNKSLELFPDSVGKKKSVIYWYLERCYASLKEYSKAISTCNLWINDGHWYIGNAYLNLGINYYSINDFSNSIAAYSSALQYNYDTYQGHAINATDIYSYIKECYKNLGNPHGWIPAREYYRISTTYATWQSENKGNTCCIKTFAIRIKNQLPISIQAVNLDLIIKDKKGTIVYKRNHTAWVNGLNTNEIAQSDYFDLNNEVCLPCSYVNGENFRWDCDVTGVAY